MLTIPSRLETFNAVILRNLSENPNLIYGILTSHKAFEDLGTFTLSRGLREIKRVQLAKERQTKMSESNPKATGTSDSVGNEEPQDEKARLLESEGGEAPGQAPETHSLENVNASQQSLDEQEGDVAQRQDISMTHPMLSPVDVLSATSETVPATSEKVRGKMKERPSVSVDTSSSLELASVGKNGFVPTQEWVSCHILLSYRFSLPNLLFPRLHLGRKGEQSHNGCFRQTGN